MWVKCAVAFAATIAALPAQQWEVAPIGGYLRLSKKPLGSLNSTWHLRTLSYEGGVPPPGSRRHPR